MEQNKNEVEGGSVITSLSIVKHNHGTTNLAVYRRTLFPLRYTALPRHGRLCHRDEPIGDQAVQMARKLSPSR